MTPFIQEEGISNNQACVFYLEFVIPFTNNSVKKLMQVRTDARFYQVKFDEDGEPNWEDVQRAAQRITMLRIRLNNVSAVRQ